MKWVPLVTYESGRRVWLGHAAVECDDRYGPEIFVDEVEDIDGWLYAKYRGRFRTGYTVEGIQLAKQERLW